MSTACAVPRREFCSSFASVFCIARALLLKPASALYRAPFLYHVYLFLPYSYFLLSLYCFLSFFYSSFIIKTFHRSLVHGKQRAYARANSTSLLLPGGLPLTTWAPKLAALCTAVAISLAVSSTDFLPGPVLNIRGSSPYSDIMT